MSGLQVYVATGPLADMPVAFRKAGARYSCGSLQGMSTYRAIQLKSGRWGVEWSFRGDVQGRADGSYSTEVDALIVACEFGRMERQEAARLRAIPTAVPPHESKLPSLAPYTSAAQTPSTSVGRRSGGRHRQRNSAGSHWQTTPLGTA
jgi:hypothetical protein